MQKTSKKDTGHNIWIEYIIFKMTKVAVVTGANKGIGVAIVRGLCKKFDGDVYLTSRDVARGQVAVKALQGEGLLPKFHQLDITNQDSLQKFKDFLVEKYGGLDVLVNNAGTSYGPRPNAPRLEKCEVTVEVNFFGTARICEALFLILKPGARVVHLSSMGFKRQLGKCSSELQEKLKSCQTVAEVGEYMSDFVNTVKTGTQQENGWPMIDDDDFPNSMAPISYGISKAGISLITPIQQEIIDRERPGSDIVINSCCPGRVKTEMSNWKGDKNVDEGAASPIKLALLGPGVQSPRGEFLRETEIIDWK